MTRRRVRTGILGSLTVTVSGSREVRYGAYGAAGTGTIPSVESIRIKVRWILRYNAWHKIKQKINANQPSKIY